MSQDINALEIARNVKPRAVGAFMTGPSNQDCFNAADCIIAQADRIEALERQLAEARQAPTVEQVEDAVGMASLAWDCIDPQEIIDAVLKLATAPSAGQANGVATVNQSLTVGDESAEKKEK
jgi:hypothetical protein